jgi:hypothetical protein
LDTIRAAFPGSRFRSLHTLILSELSLVALTREVSAAPGVYPQEIQRAFEITIPTPGIGLGAAFTVEQGREKALFVIYEFDKGSK